MKPDPSAPWWAEVTQHAGVGHALRCRGAFAAGEVLADFGPSRLLDAPSRHTLQIDEGRHIELVPACLTYINHACDPNVHFDLDRRCLVACRPIRPGDDLLCFYPATEWEMVEPFACRCGSPACLREVRGAADLRDEVLARHALSPYVRRRLAARGR